MKLLTSVVAKESLKPGTFVLIEVDLTSKTITYIGSFNPEKEQSNKRRLECIEVFINGQYSWTVHQPRFDGIACYWKQGNRRLLQGLLE